MLRRYIRRAVWRLSVAGLVLLGLAGCVAGVLFIVPGMRTTPPPNLVFRLAFQVFPVLFFAGFGLALLIQGWRYRVYPERHPVFRLLGAFGPAEQILYALESELSEPERVVVLTTAQEKGDLLAHLERGDVLVTASWIVQRDIVNFGPALRLVPLPLVAQTVLLPAVRSFVLAEGGRPVQDCVRVHLLDGRVCFFTLPQHLGERLQFLIRAATDEATQALSERWNPIVPRQRSDGIHADSPHHGLEERLPPG